MWGIEFVYGKWTHVLTWVYLERSISFSPESAIVEIRKEKEKEGGKKTDDKAIVIGFERMEVL